MAKKVAKISPYDSAEYLDSRDAINAYMEEALETDDPAFIANALGVIARARHVADRQESWAIARKPV